MMRGSSTSRHVRAGVVAAASTAALVAAMLTATPAPAATECSSPPEVLPVDQLVEGMTGSGMTTIRGTTPTTFQVEVLGVLNDYIWLDIDAIVVRITGPQSFLDEVGGVFYGMSGSPVYVNGKLIGSVSYGVSFDPTIVGLTPAQSMVDLFDGQDAPAPTSMPEAIPFDASTRSAIAEATGLSTDLVVGGLQLIPTRVGVSGLSASRIAEFQQRLDERGSAVQVMSAGGMPAALPVDTTPFTPGQPIGSVLSWGDYTISAAGTVAVACGDEVVAYGHSLFGRPAGDLEIGIAGAKVLAVGNGNGLWAGDMVPVLTEPRGTFMQDRFAGQAGFVGVEPPSSPITSTLTSLDTGITREGLTESIYQETWWLEETVWGHLILNFGAVQEGLGPGSSDLTYTIHLTGEDGTPFTVANHTRVASPYDATESVWRLINTLDQLIFNPFEPIHVTSVDADGSVTAANLNGEITRVRTSSSLDPGLLERDVIYARPDERVSVEVTMTSTDGVDTVTTFTVKVPKHATRSKVTLRGGHERWYQRRIDSLEELVDFLNGGEHADDLVVSSFGRKQLRPQPVVVLGKASFVIMVATA